MSSAIIDPDLRLRQHEHEYITDLLEQTDSEQRRWELAFSESCHCPDAVPMQCVEIRSATLKTFFSQTGLQLA